MVVEFAAMLAKMLFKIATLHRLYPFSIASFFVSSTAESPCLYITNPSNEFSATGSRE